MSNAKRPTTARKTTRSSEEKREAALDNGLTITVDGRSYTVREGDLTSLDTLALRREVGISFAGIMQAIQTDPDIDLIAAIMWLSRRIAGEKSLSFETVALEVDYDLEIDLVEPAEPESDPQPSGGDC